MDIGNALSVVGKLANGPELAQRWKAWSAAPENRAALLQAGLALMQPVGIGQSPIGHLGQAIGQGASARDKNIMARNEQATLKQKAALDAEQVRTTRERLAADAANDKRRLELDQKRLGLEERRVGVDERSAASLANYRDQQLKGGGKSLQSLWTRDSIRDENAITSEITRQAAREAQQLTEQAFASGDINTVVTAQDLLSDPAWMQRTRSAVEGVYSNIRQPVNTPTTQQTPLQPVQQIVGRTGSGQPYTEDDLVETMRATGLTREQVIERLKSK